MSARPFHLAWFLQGSSVQAWGEPWTGHIGKSWEQPELFLDMARSLERACFDYILLEDSSYVGESFGGSTELYLKHGIAVPRQDPSVVAYWHRSDLWDLCVSAVSAGAACCDSGPGFGWADRLEHGDR
jgi:hypothetical protein